MGSLAKGSLRKVCGSSAEILRKVRGQYVLLRQENSAESLRKCHGNLRKIFCNDPFPNDPISVVLRKEWGKGGEQRGNKGGKQEGRGILERIPETAAAFSSFLNLLPTWERFRGRTTNKHTRKHIQEHRNSQENTRTH